MSIRRFLVPALSLVVLACASVVAEAQSGPAGGGGKKGTAQAGASQKLTAERVAVLFNSKVQMQANGDKAVSGIIEKDGWKYEITIVFLAGGQVWDIYSALSGPGQTFTQAQLDGMQQKNNEWKAQQKFFMINQQDKRLYLADINFKTDISEQGFAQALESYMATIRSTHDLWKAQ
jgi:hypothetical protein